MPTAKVSPLPTKGSQVAYRHHERIPTTDSEGYQIVQETYLTTASDKYSRRRRSRTRDIASGKKVNPFKIGHLFLRTHCQRHKENNEQDSGDKCPNVQVRKAPLKPQQSEESYHSNSASSSSNNRLSTGTSSTDNDFAPCNGSRPAETSNWTNSSCPSSNQDGLKQNGASSARATGLSGLCGQPGGPLISSMFGFTAHHPAHPQLSAYDKVVRNLNQDGRWQREVTLGRRIGFYRFRGDIGSGNFSQVKVALHTLTKEKVAVKILDKSKLDSKTQRMLSREISSMEKLHHPNLVRLFEVIETFSKIHLVIEFASGGELFHKISTEGKFEEKYAKLLFAQIVSAIDHMHQHHIIHRDIKAENVFFADSSRSVKVGDFGFSTEVKDRAELLNTFCGSPPYAAPELFSEKGEDGYRGFQVDLWALGILLYFMVTATMPFKATTVSALKKLIIDGHFTLADHVSSDCATLVRGLLQGQPLRRLTIKQLRDSKWLRDQVFPVSLPKYKVTQGIKEFRPRGDPRDDNNGQFVARATQGKEEENQDGAQVDSCPLAAEKTVQLSEDETEAYEQLDTLGISTAMIDDNIEKGVRSNVIGTYRILLHRIVSRRYLAAGHVRSSPQSAGPLVPTLRGHPVSLADNERPFPARGFEDTVYKDLKEEEEEDDEEEEREEEGEGKREDDHDGVNDWQSAANHRNNSSSRVDRVIRCPKTPSANLTNESILSNSDLERAKYEESVNNNTLTLAGSNLAMDDLSAKECCYVNSCVKGVPVRSEHCRTLSNLNQFLVSEKWSSKKASETKGSKKKKNWKRRVLDDGCALL
ncbi:Serine/threonine-protein kinase NIM1 [Halotydeus destructor]|nr:Serine/threonine-protein kinase NIM1 [Halotydeus destructor]